MLRNKILMTSSIHKSLSAMWSPSFYSPFVLILLTFGAPEISLAFHRNFPRNFQVSVLIIFY